MQKRSFLLAALLTGLFFMMACNTVKHHKSSDITETDNRQKESLDSAGKSSEVLQTETTITNSYEGSATTKADSAESFNDWNGGQTPENSFEPLKMAVNANGGHAVFNYDPKTKKATLKINVDPQTVSLPGKTVTVIKSTDTKFDSGGIKKEIDNTEKGKRAILESNKESKRFPLTGALVFGFIILAILVFIYFKIKK